MQTSAPLKSVQYLNYDQIGYVTCHPDPQNSRLKLFHSGYHPQLPRNDSIESLVEHCSIPSPSLANDHEVSIYMSEHRDRVPEPSLPKPAFHKESPMFYLPSDRDSTASSLAAYAEDLLGSDLFDCETRRSTVLLPPTPETKHIRHSNDGYSAPLRLSSTSSSADTLDQGPSASPKRSATSSLLDRLAIELAAAYNISRNSSGGTASIPYSRYQNRPTTPTPSLVPSLSFSSTIASSQTSTRLTDSTIVCDTDPHMAQDNCRQHHHKQYQISAHQPVTRHSQLQVPRPFRESLRQRNISPPTLSPQHPVQYSYPTEDVQPKSFFDMSDDESDSGLQKMKKAMSVNNLRARASRSRAEIRSATRSPYPPSAFGQITSTPTKMSSARHSNSSGTTLRARLSRRSITPIITPAQPPEVPPKSPTKLTKKPSMKENKPAISLEPAAVRAEVKSASPDKRKKYATVVEPTTAKHEVMLASPEKKKRAATISEPAAAEREMTSASPEKKIRKTNSPRAKKTRRGKKTRKISLERVRAWLRKLLC